MTTILNKTKKAPKWVAPKPKTVFKTSLEKKKYWEKEKTYWREGYGEGYAHICGMHYFYLTQGWLKDGSDGTLIRPRYRDGDEWIIEPLHDAFWNLNNHIGLVKRREIGATSIGAGLLPAYTQRMFPNSTFGMTSCDQTRIFKAYSDKTDVFIKKLDSDIAPVLDRQIGFKENATKQQVYLRLPWLVTDPVTGEEDYNFSEIYAKQTSDNDSDAKGFSGSRLRAAYLDEFPLHKRKSILLGSIQSTVMKSTMQSGLLFWAGTVESGITPEQINELQKLVRQSDILKFKVIFASAWWCLDEFMDENGFSDEKKGTEWVMRERDRLSKLEDKSYLNAFIKNYPLTLDEIFELGGSSRFDEMAHQAVKDQKKIIDARGEPIPLYNVRMSGPTVIAEPHKEGKILVLEPPKPGVDYVFGYDGVMTSQLTATNENNPSMLATIGTKGMDIDSNLQFAPVCLYAERPKSIEIANKNTLALIAWYNKYGRAKVMGELNAAGENMVQMLYNAGLKSCVMMRKDLSKKGYVDTNKPWFYRNDKILGWQNEALNIYYKNYAHMVWFRQLLEDANKGDDDNKDIEDAMKAALYGWGTGNIFETPVKQKKKVVVQIIVGWENGTPIMKEVGL